MSKYILGISAYYHDSAACILRDGEIIAAAQEERFTRKKHDESFPKSAIEYCLKEANIDMDDLEIVAFYDKPLLKFTRLLETYVSFAPKGLVSFMMAMPIWIRKKIWISSLIQSELPYSGKIIFPEHHESHAASAFFPSPFEEAAVVTIDGVGEWATTTIAHGKGKDLNMLEEIHFPHSIGLLYSAMTYFTGFRVNSGEYKLMGLAPYGEAKYVQKIYDNLIDVREDGSFRLNLEYFNYSVGLTMTSKKMNALFGGPPRRPESEITQREMDIAASIQVVTEKLVEKIVSHAKKITGSKNLCLAGGVALNCVSNGKLVKSKIFDDIWIQPAAGDAGGALGAALVAYHTYKKESRTVKKTDAQNGTYLGPEFSDTNVKNFLEKQAAPFKNFSDENLFSEIANEINLGKIVGWFQGRMEFGPRALGNRSILGDPRREDAQKTINLKIKYREGFRPFAPSVLYEHVSEWFEMSCSSPYMLLVAPVAKNKQAKVDHKHKVGLDKLYVVRSEIPAVTHVDYSARVQTVHKETNPRYHKLISAFFEKTGCPVLINTSFNVRGEPIVRSPQEAYKCFMRTEMDMLVLGNHVLYKVDQPPFDDNENWQDEYELD